MYNVYEISPDIYWVGGNDRRLERFENMFPLPNGVAYNSYLILDEKTVLLDTVDSSISGQYLENITHVLGDRTLDYLIINHMEPDHCANIEEILRRFPNVQVVGNAKTFQFFKQYYSMDISSNCLEVKDGGELSVGSHSFKFFTAPMVHWPEVMMTYEVSKGILFSADAFGSFGAFAGNIFADELEYDNAFMDEARRYYTNIVGRYGNQVQMAFKKLAGLPIHMICSLHGHIWRGDDVNRIMEKYNYWSTYLPEKKGVVLVYASIYGNTENVVQALATLLAQRGVKDMRMYDISKTHPSYVISDIFKYSNVVIASSTYNMNLFFPMDSLLHELDVLGVANRKYTLIGNHTWASAALKNITERVGALKNSEIVGESIDVKSRLKEDRAAELIAMADAIVASLQD